jgi:hypothetical protein
MAAKVISSHLHIYIRIEPVIQALALVLRRNEKENERLKPTINLLFNF